MKKLKITTLILCFFIIACKKKSSEVQIPPAIEESTPLIKDGSGNVYSSIKIGSQTWLTSDLTTKKFSNGDPIPTIKIDSILRGTSEPKFQWDIVDTSSIKEKSGVIYTWYVTLDSRNVCPNGYHVPNASDWYTLVNFFGGGQFAPIKLMSPIGSNIEDCNFTYNIDKSLINVSGFSGIAKSYRVEDYYWQPAGNHSGAYVYGVSHDYYNYTANWWTTTKDNNGVYIASTCDFRYTNIKHTNENSGLAIRCIKD